jgi:CelD/BcsL family acetyltransferase involved in cellulose biosynthesis
MVGPWKNFIHKTISEPIVDTTSLQTTQVRCLSDLDNYLDTWRALADGAPMRSPEWFLAWWKFYAVPDDELSVLLFHEPGGLLVGLAPLYIKVADKRRTVCLLGSGDASTNHTTWLAATVWENQVSSAVAQFLLDLKPGWQCVQFDSVDADDVAINATVTYLAEKGCHVRRMPRHNCWRIALPATWDGYLKILSKTHRKRCLKLQRQFLESGLVKVHLVSSEVDFARGFEILLQLHSARWGDTANPQGYFSDHKNRVFHEMVARELLKRNQLLLVWLEYDGRPVAVEYQFIDKKTVYSYQAGMDPSIIEFPPGNLSIMTSIQFAIEQGCEFFDFSRGDQPYKVNWRATPKACNDVRIWPDNISGRLEHAIWGMRNMSESGRMHAVKWIKARVPPHFIDAWRHMCYTLTGKRRGPHKVGTLK